MRRLIRSLLVPVSLAGVAICTPVLAQAPQDAEGQRAALNREQAAMAQDQIVVTTKKQQERKEALTLIEQDEQMYGDLRREYPQLLERYETAKTQWEAAVAACARRDLANCPTATPEK